MTRESAALGDERIRGFDGVRALAVAAVVLTHLGVFDILLDRGLLSDGVYRSIRGAAGVQAFFVLSGFLITTLLLREQNVSGRISLRGFFVRRVLRIFPIYYLSLVFLLVLHLSFGDVVNLRHLLYAFLYVSNFTPAADNSPLLDHAWSLSVEEHFYLVWPLAFLLCARRPRRLLIVVSAFIAISLASAAILGAWPALAGGENFYRWTPVAGIDIALGCLAALMAGNERCRGVIAYVAQGPWALLIGVLLWMNEAAPFVDAGYAHHVLRAVGFAVLLTWMFNRQHSRTINVLEWAPLVYLGQISYGVYIYQGVFLSNWPVRVPGEIWPPDIAIGLLLLMITAPLSYRFIETPIRRLQFGRRRLGVSAG